MQGLHLLCVIAGLYQVLLSVGCTNVELQSYNFPLHYVKTAHRLHGGSVTILNQAQPEIWDMVSPGLCGQSGTVSFRLNGNRYLRHRGFIIYVENNDNSPLFANAACFYLRVDKWFPGFDVLESVNYPNRFIRHQNYQLKLHSYSSTTLFEKDASFRIFEPKCKQFRSHNYPTRYFGLTGRAAYISQAPAYWIPLRPGLAGHSGSVSFRSCYNAAKYLRHAGFLMYSDAYDGSQLFRLDATFLERNRYFPGTTAYESVNYPYRFIRHYGFRLRLDSYDAASIYKKDASYYEVEL